MSSKKHSMPHASDSEGSANHSESEQENEFIVEKILAKRKRGGRVEYYLKWKGFSETDNTWEPVANLGCPDLIADFEEREKLKEQQPPQQTPSQPKSAEKQHKGKEPSHHHRHHDESPSKKKRTSAGGGGTAESSTNGFDRNLIPEKILGATDSSGELTFLMKWKNSEEADLIPAKLCNQKCPQVVIQFYESRLTWKAGGGNDED